MIVLAPETVDVHRDGGGAGEALQAVADHLRAEVADPLVRERELADEEGPVRQVDHRARQRFVQRRVRGAEAGQAGARAEALVEGGAQGQEGVFGGVVVVDWGRCQWTWWD